MNLIDYREKLGIAFCDEDKIEIFLAKAYMTLSETIQMDVELTTGQYNDYCFNAGIKAVPEYYGQYADNSPMVFAHLQKATDDFRNFIYYYSIFINALAKNPDTQKAWIDAFNRWASQSGIQFDFLKENDNYFIFPKGAKELDDALVSEPLEWLSEYPQAHKTYCIALKQYSDGIYIRDVADNLRKALEAFLQEFLGNTKNLETNKNDICKYLGEQGVDAGIAGLFQPLINAYKNINDRIVKHNDAVDEKLLEFLLYQTGVLIRMVISIKKSEV